MAGQERREKVTLSPLTPIVMSDKYHVTDYHLADLAKIQESLKSAWEHVGDKRKIVMAIVEPDEDHPESMYSGIENAAMVLLANQMAEFQDLIASISNPLVDKIERILGIKK